MPQIHIIVVNLPRMSSLSENGEKHYLVLKFPEYKMFVFEPEFSCYFIAGRSENLSRNNVLPVYI